MIDGPESVRQFRVKVVDSLPLLQIKNVSFTHNNLVRYGLMRIVQLHRVIYVTDETKTRREKTRKKKKN